MALKTVKQNGGVREFLASIEDEQRQKDCRELVRLFQEWTGEKPALWGSSIVGFGSYHYKSERSAQEGDWPLTGFSPRKQSLTIYIMPGFADYREALRKLGPHTKSVSCLYLKRLRDVSLPVLKRIVVSSVRTMKKRYPINT